MAKDVQILDVTVRDGSYAIDYQYTPSQVAKVAAALDEAGIPLIEVSHGCGLGARENLGIPSAASDREYVMAAKKAVKKAKIGVIAGPEPVTKKENIDSIADFVGFIRFAANSDNVLIAEPNVKYAKKLGIDCFFQMMRATRITPKKLLDSAKKVEEMGVSTVYLVDTAGHFIPKEVSQIIRDMKKGLSIRVGFHGHNNLGLAIANSLAAIEAGCDSVDASLLGIGRAGGNAQIEALVSLMKRMGLAKNINLDLLLHAAEEQIAPIMPPSKGISRIDITTADANIDLYPMSFFEILAKETRVDFKDFIRKLASHEGMTEVDIPRLEETISHFGGDADVIFAKYGIKRPKN
jgi:4-hydroxy 2-oxovalerate aldolase